jgi:hypothetical protein
MATQVNKLTRPDVEMDDGLRPESWRAVAARLMKSARLIWPPLLEAVKEFKDSDEARRAQLKGQADYFQGFFVLVGLAVENELKARILQKHLDAGRKFPPGTDLFAGDANVFPNTDHNLTVLADWTGFTFTDGEKGLLDRLSSYLVWAGRYPIPKNAGKVEFPRTTRDRDLQDIESVIAKLRR